MSFTSELPLRIGTPEEFACVRSFFHNAGFNDATLRPKLAIEDMSEVDRVNWEKVNLTALESWCLRLFTRGCLVSETESRSLCGEVVFSALQGLGLIRPARQDPASLFCPVWLYPVDGLVMASDRRDDPEDKSFMPAEDVVFPAIYGGTLRFLELLPEARGGDALDLCGGSGIGALHLSRTARSAATADLTTRSALFAEFNGYLNGVQIRSLCGDVYSAVLDQQFDLITAHPPFVPATGENMTYRDGGDTGEEVTRRIIEGLPAHLRPGGTCMVLCVARDTAEQTFEQRARDWLGARREEFDVLFGLEKALTIEEVVESMCRRTQRSREDQARLRERFHSLGTRQFVYGALFLRRYAASISQPPLRLRLTRAGRPADFERVFAWRQRCRQPEFEKWFVSARPQLAPQLELSVSHVVQEGELVPAEFVFSLITGFEARLRPDAWVVPLLARLNGTASISEVFQKAAQADELPKGFSLDAFAGLVKTMIERGFFVLPDDRLINQQPQPG